MYVHPNQIQHKSKTAARLKPRQILDSNTNTTRPRPNPRLSRYLTLLIAPLLLMLLYTKHERIEERKFVNSKPTPHQSLLY